MKQIFGTLGVLLIVAGGYLEFGPWALIVLGTLLLFESHGMRETK
jgi:hypothetical protein